MALHDLNVKEVVPSGKNFTMLVPSDVYDTYVNTPLDHFTTELISKRLHDGDIFIDIGAHYGLYTLTAGMSAKCRIMAFEPLPASYDILIKNIDKNGLRNTESFNLALSDTAGIRELSIDDSSGKNGFSARQIEKISVKTETLDHLLMEIPSHQVIISIDADGREIAALRGMDNLLRNTKDVELFIRFNPSKIVRSNNAPEDLLGMIDALGFDIFFIEDDKRETYKIRNITDWNGFFDNENYKKIYFNIICIKKEKSLSLCIISHSSQLEGAERSLIELTRELIRNHGSLCTVILPEDGPLKARLENTGASTLICNYPWWCNPNLPTDEEIQQWLNHGFAATSEKIDIIKKINPDVIITNTIVVPWGSVISSILNKPHIWYVREFGQLDHGLKFYMPFSDILEMISRSDMVITNSQAVRKSLFGNSGDNIITLYNHIELPKEIIDPNAESYFKRTDALRLILLSRIEDAKGQKDAILAIRELTSKGRDVELALLGSSNPGYLAELKGLVRDNGLEEYIDFMGYKENPYTILNQADIVLLCSRNEAFGRTVLEAMLLKKPVIGTNSGGVPELLREHYNGLLYDPGDHQQLADRIEFFIDHRDKLVEYGKNGYHFVKENFTEDKYGGEVYRRLMALKHDARNTIFSSNSFTSNLIWQDLKLKNDKLQKITQDLKNKNDKLLELDDRLLKLDTKLQTTEQLLVKSDRRQQSLEQENNDMKRSIVWQMVMKYQRMINRLFPQGTRRSKAYGLGLSGLRILINEGPKKLIVKSSTYLWHKGEVKATYDSYEEWIKANEPDDTVLKNQVDESAQFSYKPKISIITPVWNIDPSYLKAAIESVIKQTYDNWELCIVDGHSDNSAIIDLIKSYTKRHANIKAKFSNENLGISGNTNEALKLAEGDFITFLDHDDTLAPFALFEVVKALNEKSDIDVIYSDKDLITQDGSKRFQPLFKPDWSPEIMYSANYLAHMCVIRKKIIDQVGNCLSEMDGAQDWDLFFRVTENTQKIHHIPQILYHWRSASTSCAELGVKAKPYIFKAQKKAIMDHLSRISINADPVIDQNGIIQIKWNLDNSQKVSIIIPSRNIHLLKNCISSIVDKTTYVNYEIIIIDTGIDKDEADKFFNGLQRNDNIKLIQYRMPFNYSAVNNYGAKRSTGDLLLFLNDDTEVISADWLEDMAGWFLEKNIGIVGGKLLYPNNSIQHAGVIIGLTGFAGHTFSGAGENNFGIYGSTEWYRNYLAVTGACMMIRRDIFEEIGGFDEGFILCGSDVEICLKVYRKGCRILYDPFVKLKHLEAASRGKPISDKDFQRSFEPYRYFLENGDPYYNFNLSNWDVIPSIKKKGEKTSIEFVMEVLENGYKS